jgi:hypothetical protein
MNFWEHQLEDKKRKRVNFIGSGPSCGVGLPSVNELCKASIDPKYLDPFPNTFLENDIKDEIITLQNTLENALHYFFPRVPLDQINFEEALTVLEESGIGPEISGISRGSVSGSIEHPFNLNDLKRELLLGGTRVLWSKIDSLSNPESDSYKPNKAFKVWQRAYSALNAATSKFQDVVITTNYDVIIENSLLKKYIYSNFLPERTLILKLHGSMNWYKLEPNVFFGDFRREGIRVSLDYKDEELLDYVDDSRVIAAYPKEEVSGSEPVIITPQISKNYSAPLFKRIWWLATKVLQDADELVILGYSFSNHDFFVKRLVDLAINSIESKITKISHFDRDAKVRHFFEFNPGENLGPMRRKYGVDYQFREIDFSKHCPNLENLESSFLDI